jgi:hypothetical protein
MNRLKSIWQLPVRRLERAVAAPVAGRERPWAVRLGAAVEALAEVLRAHAHDLDSPDGLFTDEDLTRPSLLRQVGELRREYADLFIVASRLHHECRSAAQAFTFSAAAEPADDLSFGLRRPGGIPEFGRLRGQAQSLLRAVRRRREEETSLVLESVTTDIGVGD